MKQNPGIRSFAHCIGVDRCAAELGVPYPEMTVSLGTRIAPGG